MTADDETRRGEMRSAVIDRRYRLHRRPECGGYHCTAVIDRRYRLQRRPEVDGYPTKARSDRLERGWFRGA